MKCINCKFFEQVDRDEDPGLCHRYPPRPISTNGDTNFLSVATLPVIEPTQWCGEFKPREQK